jgi:hypothetical protein
MGSFLLVLVAALAAGADDHPVPDPAGGVTAWGKPMKGLQAGLRCPKTKQIVTPKDEQVDLEVVVRNVSDKAVTFKYLPGVHYWGTSKESTVEVTGRYLGNGRAFTAHIQPGKEMLLGRVTLGHVRPKAPPSTSYSPRPELAPGKYQVGSDNVAMSVEGAERAWRLGTGYLDIEIRGSK